MMITKTTRRVLMAGLTAVILAACGESAGGETTSGDLPAGVVTSDIAIGPDDAPLELVEYASPTCPACKQFHDSVGPVLKEYVEAGDLRWVFREFPTAPQQLSVAGALVARCAGPDKAFDVLEDLFANQSGVLDAARKGTAEAALKAVGARHGVDEARFETCLDNRALREISIDVIERGDAAGVSVTPTLYFNGALLRGGQGRTPENMRALIEAALNSETN